MVERNVRQRTKQLPSMEARSHRPSSKPLSSTNSSTPQRDPISDKGDKEEIPGDGTDVHR